MRQAQPVLGFSSKKALAEKVQNILHNSTLGRLSSQDEKLMLNLFALHPKYEEKRGCGIAHIGITYWHHLKTRGFYFCRLDGSIEDFSYKKCLTPPNQWLTFRDACDYAVADQVMEFKRLSLKNEKGYWSETEGKWISSDDVHVDHVYPFALLLKDWLIEIGLRHEDIPVVSLGTTRKIQDDAIEESWKKYHKAHARLQILSKATNIAKSDSYAPHKISGTNYANNY